MAEIEITADSLVVHMTGADVLWALRSQLTIPLAHVVRAEGAEEQARQWFQGIRLGGTHIPGVISAGTFYRHGEWLFWDVHHAENAIAIYLKDERYAALIVEVADSAATLAAINGAVRATPDA
ncbi:MAG: hypothetical protein ACRDHP_09925 [Ktedonobacterales bacterium]